MKPLDKGKMGAQKVKEAPKEASKQQKSVIAWQKSKKKRKTKR
jgi:hypothetical protein